MPHLMTSAKYRGSLDVQQPLCKLSIDLVEPIVTVPAHLSVEEFGSYLRKWTSTNNIGFDWALVERDGKLLGLLDSQRLLQYLASLRGIDTEPEQVRVERSTFDSFAQLLERLPWPIMLQTGAGEVVMQNLGWWQQFGALSDPEKIRREVTSLLRTSQTDGLIFAASAYPNLTELCNNTLHYEAEPSPTTETVSSQCQLGSQPGTCICVFSGQNGQDRVWQFVKIPLSLSLVSSQNNEKIWLLLATDVTKEQQMASELAAKNADLIQLNRLKDEFLACISHELKTPLTAVLGLSTLLQERAMGQLNERQARYARLIHQSGRHLMTVVNDILDLTRMETGQMEVTLQPVQIRTVCDRAIQQARSIQGEPPAEQKSDNRFTLSIEPGLDSLVADERRLRQMLVHLVSNAFKFTEAGGEIGLQVSRWEGWIAFTVWDTGIGIPEHQQHLIFQKFQQLENPLTRRFEGTGLGLVLTRALARLHGGDVSFLSTEGKGSQFTLLLPPSPPPSHAIQSPPSERLVLVVEAAPRFIEDLTHLIDLGYRLAIARSGTEALEKARKLQPAAILLNPLLPLLSGWDVLTLLKSDTATYQIPVIVTATRADQEQAFLNRADSFLSLPVHKQVLQQLLARFCPQTQISSSEQGVSQSTLNETPLTILRLVSGHSSLQAEVETPGFAHSSTFNYRVLEADDLEQAELLAQVWQPDVVLLDEAMPEPVAYLKQLSQHPSLKSLPLVTLEPTTTQAANQVTGLSVFPCLIAAPNRSIDALLPIIRSAIGSM